MFNSLMRGEKVDFSMFSVVSEISSYAINSSSTQPEIQKEVVVIPIHGVIMKYDYCGDMGMLTFEGILKEIKSNDRIGAVVLDIDSGGGQATYLDHVASAIRELNEVKPVLTHFSGMCCSAAYYIASQSREIFASSILDKVGSIGTMCSLYKNNQNSTAEFEIVSYYASASVNKNISYRDAEAGKPEKMIQCLDKYNTEFIANVKVTRPDIDSEAFTGVDVYADKAIKLGMIDGMKRLDEVIQYAFSLIN